MLRRLGKAAQAILRDEHGQTMLEYIIIVVIVVIAGIVAFRIIARLIKKGAESVSTTLHSG